MLKKFIIFCIFFILGSSLFLFSINKYWRGTAGGAWNINANWSSTTPAFTGTTFPIVGDVAIFNNVDIDSCTLTVAANCDGLQLQAGYTGSLNTGAFVLSVGTGDLIIAAGATLNGGAAVINVNSNVITSGTLTGNVDVNFDFTVNGGTTTLNGTINFITGNFLVTGGTFDNQSTTYLRFDDANRTINQGVVPNLNKISIGSSTKTLASNLICTTLDFDLFSGPFSPGTLVTSTFNVSCTDLTMAGSAILNATAQTAANTIQINGNAIDDGANNGTFTGGAGNITITGNLDINTVTATSSGITSVAGGTVTLHTFTHNNGTLRLNGGGAQAFTTNNQNLYDFNANSAATITVTNNLNVLHDLTVNSGTLNIQGNTLTVTRDLTGTGNLTSAGGNVTVGRDWSLTGTFIPGGNTVLFNGTGSVNNTTFNNLEISAGTRTISVSPLTVNNNLTISGGTFQPGGSTVNVGGNWVHSGGTFTSGASTVNLTNNGNVPTETFYNLTNSGGTRTVSGTITVNQDLTISGGDLQPGANTINVGRNWAHSAGLFTCGTSTVNLNTATTATVSGNTTFNILTCTTGGKTINFTAGSTQTMSTLTLTGVSNNLIILRSTVPGNQWFLTNPVTTVSFVDVEDSNASTPSITANTSKDYTPGSCTNWIFPTTNLIWDGSTSTDWNVGSNWNYGYVPNSTDNVEIANAGNQPATVTGAAVTVNNLIINAGARLDTNGFAFTASGTFTNNGTFQTNGSEVLSLPAAGVAASGIMEYKSVAAGSITFPQYYNLTISAGNKLTTGNVTVANDLTLSGGTLNIGVNTLGVTRDITGIGNLTSGGGNITVGRDWLLTGTFTPGGNTVFFNGSGNVNNSTFYNLTNTSGNRTLTAGPLTTTNDFSITAGNFNASGRDLNIGGNWTDAGSFTSGGGTQAVIFTGTGNINVEPNFNRLIINSSGTVTVNGNVASTYIALYNGTLNFSGAQTLHTTGDFIAFGNGYNNALFTADWVAPAPAPNIYNNPGPIYTSDFNAGGGSPTLTVDNNFYVNGCDMIGTANWSLNLPDNNNQSVVNARAYGAMTVSYSQASRWVSGTEGSPTDGLNNTNWDFTIPTFVFETISDRVVRVTCSTLIENSNNEISGTVAAIFYNQLAPRVFSGSFIDVACTTTTNGSGDLGTFYLRANGADTWNTDATGAVAGTGTDYTGNTQILTPDITMAKGILRNAHKNQIAAQANYNTGDRCLPVTIPYDPGDANYTGFLGADITGYVNRIFLRFSENVTSNAFVLSEWTLTPAPSPNTDIGVQITGYISGSGTNILEFSATSTKTINLVNLGPLLTKSASTAIPAIPPYHLQDSHGNDCIFTSRLYPPPFITETRSVPGSNLMYVEFNTNVYHLPPPPGLNPPVITDFEIWDRLNNPVPGLNITNIQSINGSNKNFIFTLSQNIDQNNIVDYYIKAVSNVTPTTLSNIQNFFGITMVPSIKYPLSYIGINFFYNMVIQDSALEGEDWSETVFDGSGKISTERIRVRTSILNVTSFAGLTPLLYYDTLSNYDNSKFWYPYENTTCGMVIGTNIGNNTWEFVLPSGDSRLKNGNDLSFIFKYGEVLINNVPYSFYCYRGPSPIGSPNFSPYNAETYMVKLQNLKYQNNNVTILNNVINPNNGEVTKVLYDLNNSGPVSVVVYDLAGDAVKVLKQKTEDAGEHSVSWDGKNENGKIVVKGVYFIRVRAPGIFNQIRKVLIIK